MNNRQVAHLWANQSRESAHGSNFYFKGPTIYSYGEHFPIARFVEHKGRRAVLFTTDGYSASTSRHISYTRSALYGLDIPVFHLSRIGDTRLHHPDNRAEYAARIASAVKSAAKATRHSEMHINQAIRLTQEANQYSEFFGLRWRMKEPEFSAEFLAAVREREKKAAAAKAAKTAKLHKARLAAEKEARDQWRSGDNSRYFTDPVMLRVSGDMVETSRGAHVPLSDAVRAIAFVRSIVARGASWHRNGERFPVGDFQLDSVSESGEVRAGCHVIGYQEIEYLDTIINRRAAA